MITEADLAELEALTAQALNQAVEQLEERLNAAEPMPLMEFDHAMLPKLTCICIGAPARNCPEHGVEDDFDEISYGRIPYSNQ